MQTKKSKFLLILVMAVALLGLVVPAQAETIIPIDPNVTRVEVDNKASPWDTTRAYNGTVTMYDIAVGNKLKGASDDTVRILSTQSASPYYVLLATDRSAALPMNWVTETIHTNTVAMRGCAIGDVDNDGQNEIIVGTTSSPYMLKMIKWTGGAWVTTVILTTTSSYVGAIYDIAIGDADNDPGTPNDIIFTNPTYGVMKARYNGATFDTTRIFYSSGYGTFYGVAIGNYDLAHAGDELVAVTSTGRFLVAAWTGGAWVTGVYWLGVTLGFYDVAVGDFDASNAGDEIAINNSTTPGTYGAVIEVFNSGGTIYYRLLYLPATGWSSNGEIAVGDFYTGNAGAEIVAVSGSGTAYEARLVYGSGGTWFNEKVMGTVASTYGVATGNLNRYRTGNELAVGGNTGKIWEAQERIMANDMQTLDITNPTNGSLVQGNSSIPVTAIVKNMSTNPQNQVPVSLTITDGVSYTYTDVESTGTLAQGQSQQIIFSPNWTVPNSFATYAIKVKTFLAVDEYPANDSLIISVPGVPQGYTIEGFEGTTFPPDKWARFPNNDSSWIRYTSYPRSGLADARAAYQNAWLFTPRLAVTTGNRIKFWYRAESASNATSMMVRLSTSLNQTDTSGYTTILANYPSITSTTYLEGDIDLSPYAGKGTIFIAFHRYYGASNIWYLFLDDVALPPIYVPSKDMSAISLDGLPSSFHGGDVLTLKTTVKNLAKLTAYQPIPVKLSVTGPSGYTYSDNDQNTLTDIAPLGTEQITFSPNWTIPATPGAYTIKAWSEYVGDEVPANDTVTKVINVWPSYWIFLEDFEGCTPPAFPAGYVVRDINGGTTWLTDASGGMTGNLKCAKYPYSGTFAGDDWFFTPGFTLQAGLPYKLDFYYKSGSASYIEKMNVFLGTSQLVADTLPRVWDNSNIINTTYAFATAVYSPSVTQTYYLGFHCYSAANQLSLYVDSILVYSPPPDMAAITVDNVPGMVGTGSVITVKTTVKNFSTSVGPGVPVKMKITGPGGYVYNDVDQATLTTIPAGGTEQIVFSPDWTVPSTLGSYTIKAWTEYALDQVPANDTVTYSITVARAGGLMESFTGTTFPPPGWTVYNFFTTADDAWSRYTVYYNSAPACARIYYDVPNNDWLITPRLRVVTGDELRFWWRTQSTSYTETLFVRVSTNPDVSDTGSYLLIDQVSSTGNISWFQKVIDLSTYADQDIYIAFWYRCNNNYGMAIDDVTGPYFPPQIKVIPASVYVESFPDSFFDIFFNVSNIGGGTLNYTNSLSSLKSWLTVHPTSGSLANGEQDEDTLSFNTTGMDGHYYDTLVITSNSGEKATNLVPIHIWVRLIPNISVSPDSLAVGVNGNSTKDTAMFFSNSGNGNLEYTIETEEWAKFGAIYRGEPATRPHVMAPKSKPSAESLQPRRGEKGWMDPLQGTPPLSGLGGPDVFGYRWIDSDEPGGPTFSWIEINSIGTLLSITDDGNVGPFAIGFPFEFYGVTFDSFHVASNGFVSFTSTLGNLTNDTIPNPPEPNNLLALMWDDLRSAPGGGAGNIYYHRNSERLVIEYDHVIRYGQTNCPYTMEIILYPNGKIIYQYLQMGDGTCTYMNQSTIGIENGTGTDGLEVVYNANYVHNNLAIKFSSAPGWLVFSPELGTVPPSGTDTIDVTFDATGILSGDFYGAFIITSNDPDTPVDTVPAHMHVLVPDMTFTPASIETSGTEGQAPFNVTMDVGNAGAGRLIFSIVEGIPWLSVSPVADTIPSGDPASTITLTINCTSLYAGNYQGQLKVYSNDPDFQPYATYNVSLHVGPDPDIAVSPDSFYVGLYAGLTKDTILTIANEGDGHLVWGLAIEELTSPKNPDIILTEGFEGSWPPPGWSDPDLWTQECVYYAHTGLCGAYLAWGYGLDEWLIAPAVTLGTGSYLKFWWESSYYWSVYPYDNADLFVKISTNGGSSWTTLWTFGDSAMVVNSGGPWPWTNFVWYEATLDLSAYSGSALIAWHVVANDNGDIAIDDVVVESFAAPWLTISAESGVLASDDSKDVAVHFSTVGISEDKYANLWVTSNDPDEDPVLVPVHMAVLGPEYSIVPPETLYIDVTEGAITDSFLYVSNIGGHGPLNCKMSDPVAWQSEVPDSFEVAIGGTFIDMVRVDGNLLIAGTYETYIAIQTNDFDEGNDTIVVIVRVGPPPEIRLVPPDSFRVQVLGGATKDTTLWVCNDGLGHLSFEIKTQETPPPLMFGAGAGLNTDGVQEIQKRNWQERTNPDLSSSVTGTENASARLTGSPSGNLSLSAGNPGNPVSKGDTIYMQFPTDPSGSWSFGTSDQGAGYKIYENFWGLTKPISGIEWWGLCLVYSGGWYLGDPDNLVFDISFYSDSPDDPTMPPTDLVCTYTDVVPTNVPYLVYGGSYPSYFFSGVELNPLCNLTEGWVAIQSKSLGEGYDWFLWASATTGDGYSYQEGSGDYLYDDAFTLIGGIAWLTASPVADTINPGDSTNVTVHFDATQIMGGEKYGNILVSSNAPDKGVDTVKVHMIIGGAQYSITPHSLDFNVNEGYVARDTLYVSNPGGSGPLSFKMTDPVAWLVENPDSAQVLPNETEYVTISVLGNLLIAGEYSTKIAIKSNGANQQYDTIPVTVHVGPPPQVEITPPSLSVGIIPGCTQVENLKVSNLLGAGHLRFETAIGPAGPKADVLVVDDDHSNLYPTFTDVTSYFTAALTANGYTYDIFEVPAADAGDGPTAATMAGYPVVIWSCGESWQLSQTLTTNDETNLATYLDGGGSLFLSAQDYFWDRYSSAGSFYPGQFPYDYLAVTSVTQDVWYVGYPATGHCDGMTGSVAEGMAFDLWDPYTKSGSGDKGPDDGLFIDELTHNGVDVFEMTSPTPTGIAACQYESPKGFKTVFTAVDFGGLTDGTSPSTMAELMGKIMEFLMGGVGCPFTVTPEADTIDPHAFIDLPVTFDGTALEACDSLTLHCELVFTTNDPGNPTVTVPVTMWSMRGDVNGDCKLDAVDVVFLLNYIFIDGPEPVPLCIGDVNRSGGDPDSDDAMYLISYLFLGGLPPEIPLAAPKGNENIGIKAIRPIR